MTDRIPHVHAWDEEREALLINAKHGSDDRFYSARAPTDERTVAWLAYPVDLELEDG